jgi:DNA-binding transcriptional MerR regulator
MKYFNLLQTQEKDFINSLQSELGFTLENEFQKDFAVMKSALKDKFSPLKDSENTVELGITLAQIKKAKEIQSYLQQVEDNMIDERNAYVQDIEKEFANW